MVVKVWEGMGMREWHFLNRKESALVDKFNGNQSKFKSWMFDLITAVRSIDLSLANEIKELLKARPKIDIDLGVFQIQVEVALDAHHAKY